MTQIALQLAFWSTGVGLLLCAARLCAADETVWQRALRLVAMGVDLAIIVGLWPLVWGAT